MQLTNPCKKCIVRSTCTKMESIGACERLESYYKFIMLIRMVAVIIVGVVIISTCIIAGISEGLMSHEYKVSKIKYILGVLAFAATMVIFSIQREISLDRMKIRR